MKFALISLGGLASSSSPVDDDAVMLSVHSVRESLSTSEASYSGLSTLVDFATAGSPRKASQLLQKFAATTLEGGEQVDPVTKEKLKQIAMDLTNNTWMSLEQSHRRDQDLINMHWRAIQLCGDKHKQQMDQDVDGLELQLVKMHEMDLIRCRGLPNHTNPFHDAPEPFRAPEGPANDNAGGEMDILDSLLQTKGDALQADWNDPYFHGGVKWRINEDGTKTPYRSIHEFSSGHYFTSTFQSLGELHGAVCEHCGRLDEFLNGLTRPNCDIPLSDSQLTEPTCEGLDDLKIDSDIGAFLRNMKSFADHNQETWKDLKKKCDDARDEYNKQTDRCHEEQAQYENAFCSYRQGLHNTCATYQNCHILSEEEYRKLIADALYAADSRKIDWKAIHKIACYIKVLVADAPNDVRIDALNKCESGNLNTLATILTGFEESNYLSMIIPEISGNVSCWDLDVPPLIDFKECDMNLVSQFPCTETWMNRYEGLGGTTAKCTSCAELPDDSMYHPGKNLDSYGAGRFHLESYGGGWLFVNEVGRSETDINDVSEVQPEGYYLPSYNMRGLKYNEVLIQRVSDNWCDSWGRQTGNWVEEDGASMCVQADEQHVYCMNNHNNTHTWRQQPISHFAALCSKDGAPQCECWPFMEDKTGATLCFAENEANVLAPGHVRILAEDERTVKVSFQGQEKSGLLRVGNYGSFLDGVGCGSITPVSYRVFVRCLGCVVEREDFHTRDGAQFNGVMNMPLSSHSLSDYTYEAWFRSPLRGNFHREIFGGPSTGLVLVSDINVLCNGYGDGSGKTTQYHLHVGNTGSYSTMCFRESTWYHVAVTKKAEKVTIYVNGNDVTTSMDGSAPLASNFAPTMGGGFTDGGQLFNVRAWNYARTAHQLKTEAMVTSAEFMEDTAGLENWFALTDDLKDAITGSVLTGPAVRYAPIYCSDLEVSGMRGC